MKTVFLAASGSIIRWAYTDIINDPKIEYCDYPYDFKQGIKKILFTRRVAHYTPFFLQKILYRKHLGYDFLKNVDPNEEIVFVVTCQYNMFFDTFFEAFIHFLKKLYPKSKFAFYYNDIIETCYPECIDMIKREFNMVLTFDKKDAEKYGLEYYGEVYSKNKIEQYDDIKPFDVFFVGSDRKRFDTIMKIFKTLADEELKVVFYLFDIFPENEKRFADYLPDATIEEKQVRYKESIVYRNIYCPYPRTLALIDKCKCMVEITLSAQNAATLRLLEATVYGKKLITNCRAAEEKPYYHKENIFFFNDADRINGKEMIDFILSKGIAVDYDFSPLRLVEYCKEKLFNED